MTGGTQEIVSEHQFFKQKKLLLTPDVPFQMDHPKISPKEKLLLFSRRIVVVYCENKKPSISLTPSVLIISAVFYFYSIRLLRSIEKNINCSFF